MEEVPAETRTVHGDGEEEHGGRGRGEEGDGKVELERDGALEVICCDPVVVDDSRGLVVVQTSEVLTQEA